MAAHCCSRHKDLAAAVAGAGAAITPSAQARLAGCALHFCAFSSPPRCPPIVCMLALTLSGNARSSYLSRKKRRGPISLKTVRMRRSKSLPPSAAEQGTAGAAGGHAAAAGGACMSHASRRWIAGQADQHGSPAGSPFHGQAQSSDRRASAAERYPEPHITSHTQQASPAPALRRQFALGWHLAMFWGLP